MISPRDANCPDSITNDTLSYPIDVSCCMKFSKLIVELIFISILLFCIYFISSIFSAIVLIDEIITILFSVLFDDDYW